MKVNPASLPNYNLDAADYQGSDSETKRIEIRLILRSYHENGSGEKGQNRLWRVDEERRVHLDIIWVQALVFPVYH